MPTPCSDETKRFRMIVDNSVITGIFDHAYSDQMNEIIGHLGIF